MKVKRDVVRSIPSSPPSPAPLHSDIFRPAKLRLAAQKKHVWPPGPRDPLQNLGRIGGNRSPLFPSKSVVIGPIFGQKTVWPMYALVYPGPGPAARGPGPGAWGLGPGPGAQGTGPGKKSDEGEGLAPSPMEKKPDDPMGG